MVEVENLVLDILRRLQSDMANFMMKWKAGGTTSAI